VATAVAGLEGVISLSPLSGPYDVIAVTRTVDVDELSLLIVDKARAVEGIVDAFTCPVVQR
jgi:DNA-binding Lrp family transcriptional regulator